MLARDRKFEQSIKEFSAAISLDSAYTDAYYNRGTSKIRIKDYEGAIPDFDKAIKLKPDFAKAYLNRAIAKLQLEHAAAAIEDFNVSIKLEPGNASTYFMRAQARLQTGDKDGGCSDLVQAKSLGDQRAERFIAQYCSDSASMAALRRPEELQLVWPKSEGWAIADSQAGDGIIMLEYTRNGETVDHWTEIGSVMTYRGMAIGTVREQMEQLFRQAKTAAPTAKLTVIERDTAAEHPWILFKIETNEKEPESQVWRIINGSHDLFMAFWGVKSSVITPEQQKKWAAFLKTATVVKR
jgi:tetratricopeptide (TPR) repeat protein